jgi:hypothetical protein
MNYKLTKACEIEQDSLKQSQDKMKQWYDKDAMIRQFKPVEKISVLLLIPCHPWNCGNFFGIVVKRLRKISIFTLYLYA